MPENSSHIPFANLKRVRQETSAYCGPAVLEMLFSHFGIEVNQKQILSAARIDESRVKEYGMSPPDLALATKNLPVGFNFWYKTDATASDLVQVIRLYNYPAGVNWQGIFTLEDNNDYNDNSSFTYGGEEDDEGHYSVVTDIDTVSNYIRVADPYGHYAGRDRIFSIVEFEKRWWDETNEIDPITQKQRWVYYHRLMFLVLPQTITFPADLGMKLG